MQHLAAIGVLFTSLLGTLLATPAHGESTPAQQVVGGWQFRLAASTPDAATHADAQQWHAATVPSTDNNVRSPHVRTICKPFVLAKSTTAS